MKIFQAVLQGLALSGRKIFAAGLGGSARARYLRVRFRAGTGGSVGGGPGARRSLGHGDARARRARGREARARPGQKSTRAQESIDHIQGRV